MYPIIEFNVFDLSIRLRAYPLFIGIALAVGIISALFVLKKNGMSLLKALGLVMLLSCTFFVGARWLNYIVNYEAYRVGKISLFSFKLVGFSFYGGIIFCVVLLMYLGALNKMNLWKVADELVVPFGISFCIVRLGCFFNGCCYGNFTHSPFGVPLPKGAIENMYGISKMPFFSYEMLKVHPTQLYEASAALILVIGLIVWHKKFVVEGMKALFFIIGLTSMRWVIFYMRYTQYDAWVKQIFYPLLYMFTLALGIVLLDRKMKRLDHGSKKKRVT